MNGSLRWLWLFGAVVAVALLVLAGLFRPIGELARAATLPLVRVLSGWSASSADSTDSRLKELESRVASLAVDYVRLQALEEENRTLRAQAKFLDRSGYDSVGARVIGRDVSGKRALLTIDRGGEDSLEIGQAVITDQGVFIGKISQIFDRVATVELVTDPRSRVAAALQADGQLAGVIEGRGNGAAVLTYIPSSQSVVADQLIVTAGTEDKVQGNLPIGVVNTVEGKPTDPFMNATIEPLVSLDRVVFVSVLRPTALRPRL
jgi:rod shape-determining protein MreC